MMSPPTFSKYRVLAAPSGPHPKTINRTVSVGRESDVVLSAYSSHTLQLWRLRVLRDVLTDGRECVKDLFIIHVTGREGNKS